MTIGGSWVFCADDTMANAELVVTRTDKDGMERAETFKDFIARTHLWRLLAMEKKTGQICGYYDDCRDCPIGKAIEPGYSCRGWIETHLDEVLVIYEKWGETHGSNYKGTNLEKQAEEVSTEAKVD